MRALIYEGARSMNMRVVPDPVPAADEVLIRVAYTGICGSELSGYLGHNSLRKPPLIFGHEFSGIIEQTGASAAADFQPGQRVTANPLITCGRCASCKAGRQQLCRTRKLLSAALPGSNAELVAVSAAFVYALPDEMTLQQGALVEPAACAVRAAELAQPKPGDTALVVGMGPIGLLVLQALKLHGVHRVIVADMNADRLRLAEALGADAAIQPRETDTLEAVRSFTGGAGVGIAIDAAGTAVTRDQCVRACMPGGRVIFTGLHEEASVLPVNLAIRSEIALQGAFAYSALNFETALQWLQDGRIGLGDGIVEAPLEEGASWFETLLSPTAAVSKVLLQP